VLGVYNLVFDLACLAGLIYLLLVFRRSVVLAPAMRLPLLALVAAFFVLPYQVGNATWVDARVPSTFALVLVASLDWRVPGRFPRLGEAGLAALFALRMAVLVVEWASWQPVFAEYHAAMALVDPGTKLLPIGTHPAELRAGEHPPLPHMDAFAVSQRGAFIPTMLADRAYELLHYTAADERIHNDFPDRPVIADYDFVLIVDPDHDGIPPEVEPVFRGTGFVLARVRR
jgi:hypothetical protein